FLAEMYEELSSHSEPNFTRPSTFETLMDRREEILHALIEAYFLQQRKQGGDRKLPKLTKSRRGRGNHNAEHLHRQHNDWREAFGAGQLKYGESTSTLDGHEMLSLSTGDATRFGHQSSYFSGAPGIR